MSDLEKLLKASLQEAGSDFEAKDLQASRRKFIDSRRRRRVTGFVSGIALAGAATAALLFVSTSTVQSPEESPDIAPAFKPKLLQTVPVGVEPTGVTVDASGTVWVANSGDNSVSRLEPGSDQARSISLPGAPDDVAATTSFIYATDVGGETPPDTTGSATVIDRATGVLADRDNPDDIPDGARAQLFGGVFMEGSEGNLGHVDVIGSGDALWASSAAKGGVSVTYDDGLNQIFREVPASEVAVLNGTGYALDPEERLLYPLVPGSSSPIEALEISDEVAIDGDGNLDMVGGLGSIWIVQEDVLYRIDPGSAEMTGRVDLEGGDYAAVAAGQGYIWVLESTVDESGDSRLYKVDPDTAKPVGAPLVLEGKLADVAAGGGSVWVTSRSTNSLLRISPSGTEEVVEPTPSVDEAALPDEGAQVSFAYSMDGDIWLEYADGTSLQFTDTPEVETDPEFGPVGIIFAREGENRGLSVIERSLADGTEKVLADGYVPALSPGGDLAWAEPGAPGEGPTIHVAPLSEEGLLLEGSYDFPAGEFFTEVRSLTWSEDAKTLLYQALGEGWVTVQAQVGEGTEDNVSPFVLSGVNDQPAGSTFVQPTRALEESVEVAMLCCQEVEGDSHSEVSLGAVDSTEGGATFRSLTSPLAGLKSDPDLIQMAAAHEMSLEKGRWEMFSGIRSWLISDGTTVLLVDANGGTVQLAGPGERGFLGPTGDGVFQGFALNPYLEGDLSGP